MLGALYLAVAGLYVWVLAVRPSLLVRPSIWVSLGLLARVAGAAAFAGSWIDYELAEPRLLRLVTILYPLAMLLWVAVTPWWSRTADTLYDRCRDTWRRERLFGPPERFTLGLVGAAAALVMVAYLAVVPVQKTGLVAIFTDPLRAAQAREESLKLIGFAPLRYAYLWHMEILAPILAVLLYHGWRPRTLAGRAGKPVLLAALLLSVMLSGARSPVGWVIVALAVAYLLRRGVWRGARAVLAAVTVSLLVITVLSIFRDGKASQLSVSLILDYLGGGLFRRTFQTPYETGVMTNMYAQVHGLLGVRNIRPLALLFGKEFVALPNAVGLSFMNAKVASVSANTSYLFDFQASFGVWPGWLISIPALGLLDGLLGLFRRLDGLLLTAMLAVWLTYQQTLVSSAWTVCLVTHGILSLALLAWLLSLARPAAVEGAG